MLQSVADGISNHEGVASPTSLRILYLAHSITETATVDNTIFMQRCLELAHKGNGATAPNPMVGAVLVHEGRIIGEGWHHHYGTDHAEINCLKNVAEQDRHLICEATMYVNLEPCAHYGITPPCSERLVQEKLRKVVIANCDPFEKVSGKGVEILRSGGVEVETGLLADEGFWLNRRFFCLHRLGRPYVILKWAKTREGFLAPTDRHRYQITGESAQQLSHKWRTEESAILVGTTTALNDDPQLISRKWPGRQPLRIAIDRTLKLPEQLHLFDGAAATWIVNERTEGLKGNIHFVQTKFDDDFLHALVGRMAAARILSVIVEGGANLLEQFIASGLWDEARIFTGSARLDDGLPAPVIRNAANIFNSTVGEDSLEFYVNRNSAFPYPDSGIQNF